MLFIFKIIFIIIGLKGAQLFHVNPVGGLIIGLLIGHVLDYIATIRLAQWKARRYYTARKRAEEGYTFISSLFYMFGHICAADGAVTKAEFAYIENVISSRLKLNRQAKAKAIECFRESIYRNISFQSSAASYYELHRAYPQALLMTIEMFFEVACSDGLLAAEEEKLIRTAATVFGIDDSIYLRILQGYNFNSKTSELQRSYAILGVNENDSEAEIKKKYRKLVNDFHPDKIIAKDLPNEFVDFANQKFKDIQSAYEFIKNTRSIK